MPSLAQRIRRATARKIQYRSTCVAYLYRNSMVIIAAGDVSENDWEYLIDRYGFAGANTRWVTIDGIDYFIIGGSHA